MLRNPSPPLRSEPQPDVIPREADPFALAIDAELGTQLQWAETAKRQEIAETERLEKLKALLSSQADHD